MPYFWSLASHLKGEARRAGHNAPVYPLVASLKAVLLCRLSTPHPIHAGSGIHPELLPSSSAVKHQAPFKSRVCSGAIDSVLEGQAAQKMSRVCLACFEDQPPAYGGSLCAADTSHGTVNNACWLRKRVSAHLAASANVEDSG